MEIGLLINRRYEILDFLGATNSGHSVLLCRDTFETGEVAVKALTSRTQEVWAEAQHLRQLQDDHVLPIRNAFMDAGSAFLVTDVAHFGTVQDEIERNPHGLSLAEAIRWVRHACQGVQRTHSHGLVHNDVKPANLFLNSKRECLLGDFEMASLMDKDGTAHAHGFSHMTVAPEVLLAYQASPRSDVYSLGATAYWMVTGTPPHPPEHAKDDLTLDGWFQSTGPTPIQFLAPNVPSGVVTAIEKAMARDPKKRFAGPADFASALARAKLLKRVWERVDVHDSHEGCWRGTAAGQTVLVCLEADSDPKRRIIAVVYEKSNRRVTKECRVVEAKKAFPAVHKTIQRL